jgi:hypothetical protein
MPIFDKYYELFEDISQKPNFKICNGFQIENHGSFEKLCKENGPRAIWLNRFWCLMINTTCELMYFPSVCVL